MKIDVVALKMARMATTQPHVHVANGEDCRNSPNAGEPVRRVYHLAYDGNNSNCKCHTSRESENVTRLIAGSILTGLRCKQTLLHYWGDQGRRSQARRSTQVPVLAVWLSTLPWSLRDLERAWAPFQESSAEWDYLLI